MTRDSLSEELQHSSLQLLLQPTITNQSMQNQHEMMQNTVVRQHNATAKTHIYVKHTRKNVRHVAVFPSVMIGFITCPRCGLRHFAKLVVTAQSIGVFSLSNCLSFNQDQYKDKTHIDAIASNITTHTALLAQHIQTDERSINGREAKTVSEMICPKGTYSASQRAMTGLLLGLLKCTNTHSEISVTTNIHTFHFLISAVRKKRIMNN